MTFYPQLLEATAPAREQLLNSSVVRQTLAGDVSRRRYLAFLHEAYHHVRHTVPLMMSCGSRLADSHPWLLPALRGYINEEIGHEAWILDDIAAAEGDPGATRDGQPAFATELMVAYAYDSIARRHPLSLFGMVLVLEGTSSALAYQAAGIIQQQLALPDNAFGYLRSHGELDQNHVQHLTKLMNRLQASTDQNAVIHAANRFYRLYGDLLNQLPH